MTRRCVARAAAGRRKVKTNKVRASEGVNSGGLAGLRFDSFSSDNLACAKPYALIDAPLIYIYII